MLRKRTIQIFPQRDSIAFVWFCHLPITIKQTNKKKQVHRHPNNDLWNKKPPLLLQIRSTMCFCFHKYKNPYDLYAKQNGSIYSCKKITIFSNDPLYAKKYYELHIFEYENNPRIELKLQQYILRNRKNAKGNERWKCEAVNLFGSD